MTQYLSGFVKDPVTGQMMSYADLSMLMQQRRRAAQAAAPRYSPDHTVVAKNSNNKGAPVMGNPHDGWVKKNAGGLTDLDDPTNRDSVPAMLTPGEFVINKEATQKYGPLLEKINNEGLAMRHAGNIPHYNDGGLVGFLKKHEGWRDKAYDDGYGTWTIGYGRTTNADGSPVKPGQTTTREAEDAWIQDRAKAERAAIDSYAETHGYDWNENERNALASFRYNGGQGMIDQLTDNGNRDMDTIKSKFGLYNKSNGQHSDGLQNRRNYEMELAGWGNTQPVQGTNMTDYIEQPADVPEPTAAVPNIETDAAVEEAINPTQILDESTIGALAQSLLGGGGGVPAPMPQVGGGQPIQSAAEIRESSNPMNINQLYNNGGWVHMNDGGWLSGLLGWNNNKQAADALARRPGNRSLDVLQGLAAPIDPRGPQQPDTPSQFGTDMVPPVPTANPDVRPNTVAPTANHAANRMEMMLPPGNELVPAIETAPPVPGSDEALLQGSSDSVEKAESEVAQMRKQYREQTTGFTQDPSEIENWSGSVPQMTPSPIEDPTGNPAEMGGIYAGWEDATPEQIAAQAVPQDAQQADGHNADLPVEDQVVKGSKAKEAHNIPVSEKRVAVDERLKINNETATPEETAAAETAGAKAKPERIEAAKTVLQENFGGLFDKQELARAAVLFAGAMLTGASPQKALAIAGQQYLGRLDAKQAAKVKTEQQAAAAAAKRQPTIDMTQKDTFIVDGKKVNAYKMTSYGPNGEKIHSWVDSRTQQPISATAHQNFDTTPGTPEYNKRVQDESKQYSGILEEVLSQPTGLDKDGNPITGILPKSSGPQVAKWAIKNGIPPEAMGQLIQNAGNAAIADSRGGTQARSIEAYLNEQYIESQIGDPSLFQGVQADEISGLMQDIASRAGLEGSVAQVSTPIIQAALPMWDALSPEEKERYARKAKGTNKSPFMIWMEEDLNS